MESHSFNLRIGGLGPKQHVTNLPDFLGPVDFFFESAFLCPCHRWFCARCRLH